MSKKCKQIVESRNKKEQISDRSCGCSAGSEQTARTAAAAAATAGTEPTGTDVIPGTDSTKANVNNRRLL